MAANVLNERAVPERETANIQFANFTQMNTDMQARVSKALHVIPEDAFVIYKSEKSSAMVLGYFVLDGKTLTSSERYQTLLANSISAGQQDLTEQIHALPSVHISEWVFDSSLKNKDALTEIFEYITFYCNDELSCKNPTLMLWTDADVDASTPLFYPLYKSNNPVGHNCAIAHFTNAFLNL